MNDNVIHLDDTIFNCKICNATIRFNINEPKSYIQKSEPERSFVGVLTRYAIKHEANDLDHVNVIIIDQNNQYRGHKDYYTQNKQLFSILGLQKPTVLEEYQLIEQPPRTHNMFELFVIADLKSKTFLEFVNTQSYKTKNIMGFIIDFLAKNKSIYTTLPDFLVYEYLQKKYSLFLKDESTFIVVVFKIDNEISTTYKQIFDVLKNGITRITEHMFFNSIITLIIQMLAVSQSPDKSFPYIQKIIDNTYYYSSIRLKPEAQESVELIIQRVNEYYPCISYVLSYLLDKKDHTVIDLLQNHITDYNCIIDSIEYINRRKLI